ncbi:endonuclease domain-containing protein [Calditrichota bacterium]
MTIKQIVINFSRELRKNMTDAEKVFWNKVRNKQFMGYKFLRQHPLYYEYHGRTKFFIADFYCKELMLVVEIDGGIHEQQKDYDMIRSEILERQKNLSIIRFSNSEVLHNINKVIIQLNQISQPNPSPSLPAGKGVRRLTGGMG